MRRENLAAGGHDKVFWKRSRDRSRDKRSRQRNSETWWRPTTAMLLGVSFGSYWRRLREVLMGRHGYVPLRRLGDVPLIFRWVFHLRHIWDVVEKYWWDVVITSPWDVVKTYHWHVLPTFHWDDVGCFIWDVPVTLLGRTKRRRCNVATTFRCRVGTEEWSDHIYFWEITIKYHSNHRKHRYELLEEPKISHQSNYGLQKD